MAATAYELLAFGLFAAITVGSSLGVVLVRDVWHAALLLGVALLSVAVHYIMLRAEFLAAMQILVYVGGVLILITFAVMLIRRETEPSTETHPQLQVNRRLWRGVGAIALFGLLAAVMAATQLSTPTGFPADQSITAGIGYAMFDLAGPDWYGEGFLVAFEIIDVLLVAALVAAVTLARRRTGTELRSDGGDER